MGLGIEAHGMYAFHKARKASTTALTLTEKAAKEKAAADKAAAGRTAAEGQVTP